MGDGIYNKDGDRGGEFPAVFLVLPLRVCVLADAPEII